MNSGTGPFPACGSDITAPVPAAWAAGTRGNHPFVIPKGQAVRTRGAALAAERL